MYEIEICFVCLLLLLLKSVFRLLIASAGSDSQCDAIMYHMKTASVRDLRYDFKKIEHMLSQGEEIQITKRRHVIARLLPEKPAERPPMPDFLGRLRSIYGDKVLDVSVEDVLRDDRDSRY